MPKNSPRKVLCPQCSKTSVWSTDNAYRPFCSQRCQQIDRGIWASDGYRIAGESAVLPPQQSDEAF